MREVLVGWRGAYRRSDNKGYVKQSGCGAALGGRLVRSGLAALGAIDLQERHCLGKPWVVRLRPCGGELMGGKTTEIAKPISVARGVVILVPPAVMGRR